VPGDDSRPRSESDGITTAFLSMGRNQVMSGMSTSRLRSMGTSDGAAGLGLGHIGHVVVGEIWVQQQVMLRSGQARTPADPGAA